MARTAAFALLATASACGSLAMPVHGFTGFVMVANRGSGTVSFIDPASLEVNATLDMPDEGEPMYISYDSSTRSRILVADRKNARLVVAELRGGDVMLSSNASAGHGSLQLPLPAGPFHSMSSQFFVNEPDVWEKVGPVAVTSSDVDNMVAVHNMRTLSLIDMLPLPPLVASLGGRPHDVTASGYFIFVTYLGTSDGRGYVASYIRSGRRYQFLRLIETAEDPHVAIRDGTDLIIAADGGTEKDGEVLFLRAPELVVVKRDVQPSPHGVFITFDSRLLYVINVLEGGANAVVTYDMATRKRLPGCAALNTTVTLPHNPAVTLDGGRLFITHSGGASVTSTYEIDAFGCPVQSTEKLITTGLNPFGITVVTNATDR
eukprot:jgi/Ulvmu1/6728/UM030_0063.1